MFTCIIVVQKLLRVNITEKINLILTDYNWMINNKNIFKFTYKS